MALVELVPGPNYADQAEWEAAERDSDYGLGNPAVAEINGTVVKENITGPWVRGYIIRAAAGKQPVPLGGDGSAVVTGTGWVIAGGADGTTISVMNLTIDGSITHNYHNPNASYRDSGLFIKNGGSPAYDYSSADAQLVDSLILDCTRGTDANNGNANAIAENVTVINVAAGNYGFVRNRATSCAVYSQSGSGFVAMLSGSDYNAAHDASAPGANSVDNITAAAFVDYANGDYRSSLGGALDGAGESGGHIGFLLESGGAGSTALSPDGVAQGQSVGQPSLTGHYALVPDSVSQAQGLGAPDLSLGASAQPDAIGQSQDLGSPGLLARYLLETHGVQQSQGLGASGLLPTSVLATDGVSQSQATGEPSLTGAYVLATHGMNQAQTTEAVSFAVQGSMSVHGLTQPQIMGNPTLRGLYQLAVDSLAQAQALSDSRVDVMTVLQAMGITQVQGLSQSVLASHGVVAVDSLSQSQLLSIAAQAPVIGWIDGDLVWITAIGGDLVIKNAFDGDLKYH